MPIESQPIPKPTRGYFFTGSEIAYIEKQYNAKFVDTFDLGYIVDVFYNENPDTSKGHKNYFGIQRIAHANKIGISDATKVLSVPLWGLMADNGEIIFSRYRHDFRVSEDGTVSIDGGLDYFRCSIRSDDTSLTMDARRKKLKVDKDRIVEDVG